MASKNEDSKPSKLSIPEIKRNPPDLGDLINKSENTNWDRGNFERANNNEKQWGHAGIPPEQPVDKTTDKSE